MRITKVSVRKLFGIFDHEIPLNQDSRITIIHGPNGVGKTVLFSMLHGLFHFEYKRIGRIPFKQFRIEFEGGAFITVEKSAADNHKLSIQYDDGAGTEFKPFEPLVCSDSSSPSESDFHSESVFYSLDDFYENHDLDPDPFSSRNPDIVMHTIRYGETPEWFWRIRQETRTVLIHTQRLQSDLFDKYGLPLPDISSDRVPASTAIGFSHRFTERFIDAPLAIPVSALSDWDELNELAKREESIEYNIELTIGEYIEFYIEATIERPHGVLDEELVESRRKARRERLQSLLQRIMNVYQDVEFFRELMLFKDIINERLLFKSLDIIRIYHQGFQFVADDGSRVPLDALSSGEQHLTVLYYQLLFEVQPDTLVMIDEPELSMNVVWQRSFLKDLQRIIELRKFDALIATHSPQIIHDKWDWMVALGEPEGDS